MSSKKTSQVNMTALSCKSGASAQKDDNLIAAIGLNFLKSPYQAGTLEFDGKEKLIVNFHGFDCFTFLETVIAIARCSSAGNLSLKRFQHELQLIRYRQGIIAGYASRLHYFSDWLCDNKQKGIIKDISRQMGAKPKSKVINFMTTHRNSYPALLDDKVFNEICKIEKKISRRKFYVLPAARLDRSEGKIKTGDIVAMVSNAKGLDVAHVGFALWKGKKLHLLHASSRAKSVVISAQPLLAYLRQKKKFSGIIVARIEEDNEGCP
jgi:hypothetical protein